MAKAPTGGRTDPRRPEGADSVERKGQGDIVSSGAKTKRVRAALALGALASASAILIASGVSSASVGGPDSAGSRGAIVFMSERGVGEDDLVKTSRAINADGSALRRLRWDVDSDYWTWSPDGMRVAYWRDHGVWVMNANGSERRRIVRGDRWGYTWSPDGRRLAYYGAGICVVDIAHPRERRIGLGGNVAWSPRADLLAFLRGDTLVVTRTDGTDPRVISAGVYATPRWSPDGKRIAYVRQEGGIGTAAHLYVADPDGTNARALTPRMARFDLFEYSAEFDWAPSGDRIVLRASGRAFVLSTDGGDPKMVADGLMDHTDAGPPRWSPDGKKIAFVRGSWRPVPRSDIWVMHADGSHKKRLTRNHASRGLDLQPRWEPRGRMAAQLFPRSPRSRSG
jgi:Tol biopolymer transport system component